MKKYGLLVLVVFTCLRINAQNAPGINTRLNIFELMEKTERRQLSITQLETLAQKYFDSVGTEKGSGYKQYQRWLYETKFHLDANGNILPPEYEWNEYKRATAGMQRIAPPTQKEKTQNANARVAGQWVEMGPTYINPTSGPSPGVGRVTSVAVNPDNNLIIYASSDGGGIWKSVTGGNSWTPLTDFYSPGWMHIDNLAIDPSNTNTIYALVNWTYAGYGEGVIKSTDGGNTWFAAGSGASGAGGGRGKILIHPYNSNIVFVAGSGGIYRSTNAGASWTQVHNQSNKEDIEFNPTDPNIMYSSGRGNSGTSNCVWRSVNNGVTWAAVNDITNYGRTLLAVSPDNPNVVYAVQANGSTFGRMYKSTDNGATFITTVTGDPTNDGVNHFSAAGWAMAICANPLNADEVHIGSLSLLKSINGGISFIHEANGGTRSNTYLHPDIQALEWIGTAIYCGSDGGISKSTDNGNTWTDLSTGLGIKQFYRIASSRTNGEVFTGGAQDNGTSTHRTTGWVDWAGGDGMDCLISPTNENLMWGSSQYGYMSRSADGGLTVNGNFIPPSPGVWTTPLAIESNSNIIYGGWTGVYRSTDLGNTWTKISGSVINSPLIRLAVAPSNPQYIYAFNGGGLYVTKNGGASWVTYPANFSINSIAISSSNPEKIWIATNGYNGIGWVSVSTNAGTTFTNISGNLPAINARSIVVDDNLNESVYVGMNIGVFYKDNTMTDWVDISNGLPLVAINELEIQKSSSVLRVATYGRGIWENGLYNVPPPCSAPAAAAQSITTNSATISWPAVPGANYYELKYKTSYGYDWSLKSGITATSQSLTGLIDGVPYDYQIRTSCGDYSTLQNFSTVAIPCSIPSNISAQYNISNEYINWNNVSGSHYYELRYKKSSDTFWTTIPVIISSSYNIPSTDLSDNTAYDYQVKANCSDFSAIQNFSTTTCLPPSGIIAQNVTSNQATISWPAVPGAIIYDLQYKPSSVSAWATVSGITTTSFLLTGLSSPTVYDYRVRANCSDYSAIQNFSTISISCLAPSNIYAHYNSSSNTESLTWDYVSEANYYELRYKKSSESTWTTISGITGGGFVIIYTLTGLSPFTIYDYQIRANCSDYSAVQHFIYSSPPPCGTPSGFSTQNITYNSATINWGTVFGADYYRLEYKPSSPPFADWTIIDGIFSPSYNLTGLLPSTTYYYRVKTNCESALYSPVQSFSTLAAPPSCGIPSGFSEQNITNNSANISWGAVTGANNYDLQYKPSFVSTWITVSGITTASYNLTGLSASTVYDYQVRTNCTGSSSAYSAVQNFTTLCEVPSGLSTQSITTNSATVNWNIVNGTAVYDVDYKAQSASTWINAVTATASTFVNLTGLASSTAYQWRVKADCSDYSTVQNFSTLCETPSNLFTLIVGINNANVCWSAVNGAVSYDVDYKIASSPAWINAFTADTSTCVNLTGLAASTVYDWRVRASCSDYANAQFTTMGAYCANTTYDVSGNGNIIGAAQIPLNTNINGSIYSSMGDFDHYKFAITSGSVVTVTLTTLPFNCDLQLLNNTGAVIAGSYNTGTSNESIATSVSAGTYYAQVYGDFFHSSLDCYTLKVQLQTGGGGGGKGEVIEQRIFEMQPSLYSVFPNPAKNTLNITLDGTDEIKTINIFDIYGRMIMSESTTDIAAILDINKLSDGIYFLRITSVEGEVLFREKFMKE